MRFSKIYGLPELEEGIFSKIYGLPELEEGIFSKIYGLPELEEGIFSKIYGLPELDEGIFSKIYGLPGPDEGIFSKIFRSFWIIKVNRFGKRFLQEPIWEIFSNIKLKIVFSDFTLLNFLRLVEFKRKIF